MLIFKLNKTIIIANTNNVHYKPNLNNFTIINHNDKMVYINEALEIAGLVMRKFINPEYPYEVSKDVLLKYRNCTVGVILAWDELITVVIDDDGLILPKSQTLSDTGYFLVTSNEMLGSYLQGALSYLMLNYDDNVLKEIRNADNLEDATNRVYFSIIVKILGLYSEKALCDPIEITMIDMQDKDRHSVMGVFDDGLRFEKLNFNKGVPSYVEIRKKYLESLKELEETKDENTKNQKPRRTGRVSTRRSEG